MSALAEIRRQVGRFSLVGVSNTAVDFVATNLLFFLFAPRSPAGLLAISLAGCLVATLNSYMLNSRWTFAESGNERTARIRFVVTATAGMLVNTAAFLFLMRHLPLSGLDGDFIVLNLSRLGGVVAAMAVTFCGYRLWAFTPDAGREEPTTASQDSHHAAFPTRWVLSLMALGLATRALFLSIAPVIYGDAVNYAWVARLTGSGELEAVDLFWHSLFDFWQVLFVWLGADQYAAPVLASLVPGILLIWPVALTAWRLFGPGTAILSAAFVALHPRLIEYSLNGYAESFYLLGAVWAVWGAIALIDAPRRLGALIATGLGLSVWILVRNEAVLFAGALFVLIIARHRDRWKPLLATAVRVVSVVAIMVAGYALTNMALWDEPGLMQKGSNLARDHIEMLDPRAAARETYGAQQPQSDHRGVLDSLSSLAARWPANVRYTAERLPGVLLSPLFLFALLLPILRPGNRSKSDPWPFVLLGVWPLFFYPLIQLEPRMLFPTLLAVILFGSAGLIAAARRLSGFTAWRKDRVRLALTGAMIALLLPLIPLLAWHSGKERGFHRDVGRWMSETVPAEATIVGDGYGYVAASAYWAGRRARPRLWTESPAELAASLDDDAVLVLYERYLRESNPELLSSLDEGLPGMERIASFEFERVGRVQAWARKPAAE